MYICVCTVVPEPVYLLEKLRRVNMSHNAIKELSSLIDTWQDLVTLDLTFNQLTSLHVRLTTCTDSHLSTFASSLAKYLQVCEIEEAILKWYEPLSYNWLWLEPPLA